MSSDLEQCKKSIESLKGEIEEIRSTDTSSALSEAANKQASKSLTTMKARRLLKGHFGKIYAMHWGPDSQKIVSASQDGKLLIWNASSTAKLYAVALRSTWVMTCAYSPSGNFVACGGLDNTCSLYKLPDKGSSETNLSKVSAELAQHEGYLSSCRFITDDEILTSSGDSSLILWDVESRVPKQVFNGHEGDVMAVQPYDKSGIFASASVDTTCRIWDYRSKKSCIRTFQGHESDVNTVAFFPDGNAVISGSDDSSIRFWDIRSYSIVQKYQNDKCLSGVTSVDFSSTGKYLFAGYDDYSCLAWDTKISEFSAHLSGHENRVSCLSVNKAGNALATGSWDQYLRIFA